jgi:hypothetical protein
MEGNKMKLTKSEEAGLITVFFHDKTAETYKVGLIHNERFFIDFIYLLEDRIEIEMRGVDFSKRKFAHHKFDATIKIPKNSIKKLFIRPLSYIDEKNNLDKAMKHWLKMNG